MRTKNIKPFSIKFDQNSDEYIQFYLFATGWEKFRIVPLKEKDDKKN